MNISELIDYKNNYDRLNYIRDNREKIVPFVGAGVSIGCGLYSWLDMLDIIATDYFTADEIKQMHNSGDCFSYADKIVEVTRNQNMIMEKNKGNISKCKCYAHRCSLHFNLFIF